MGDRQDPGSQVLAVLEPAVGAERPQERLLERIVGPIGAEPTAEQAEYVAAMLLVEALERWYRHGLHHPRLTPEQSPICEHAGMRAAVVGHIEWMEFVPVEAVPRPGEIVHADESWEQAAGGGSVAAVQFAKLADSVDFFTGLGNDESARACADGARGTWHHRARDGFDAPQRSGFTFIDEAGERTITTIGRKLHPRGHDDALPWHELARCDCRLLLRRRCRRAAARSASARPRRDRAGALDAPAGVRRARRARLEREGRGGALPHGADRPGAAARRDDVGSAWWLGAARRPVQRGAATRRVPDAYGAGDCFAAGSRSRWQPGSRGWRRSTSRRAAVRGARRARVFTRRRCRCPSLTQWGGGVAQWGKVE